MGKVGKAVQKTKHLSQNLGRNLILALINFYSFIISPFLGSHCRFYPSCSQYMKEAITTDGLGLGLWKGVKRICRCHPFQPGGYDPVTK